MLLNSALLLWFPALYVLLCQHSLLLTPTISWAKHGILLGRPTWCYTPFLLLILFLSCSPTLCHYMALPFGSSHVLTFTQSRSLLTTYSDVSGIFHTIATPEFYTLLPSCPACLMLPFLGQHSFCYLPSPVLLSLFEGFFGDSSLLVYTHTGYNAMSGGLHAKEYYTRRMGCVQKSSVTSVCLGTSRTMILIRWLILFVLISALFSYLCKLASVVFYNNSNNIISQR